MGKWYRVGILSALISIVLIMVTVQVSAAEETNIIKVGYVLNCGTMQSPVVKGSEGYLYEYFNLVNDYMEHNYEIEFVSCELNEIYDLLDSGEIDIFAPIAYMDEIAEEYAYTCCDTGRAVVYLSTLTDNTVFFDQYQKLNGETIAVREGEINTYLLYEFIETYGIDCEVIEVESDTFVEDMINGEYSYCLSNSMETYADLQSVAYLGTVDTYIISTKENEELLLEIDEAMEALAAAEYLAQEELYLKYFQDNLDDNVYISQSDYNLLQAQATYYVGYSADYHPLSYIDNDGELCGIAVEVISYIAEETNINVSFVDINGENVNLDIIDISIASSGTFENYSESEIYLELPFIWLENNDSNAEVSYIGVLDYYGIEQGSIGEYKYGSTRVEYTDVYEMVEDFNSGKIQGIILTSINLNKMSDDIEVENYTMSFLDVELGLSLIYPNNLSETKISVFDKLIKKMDDQELEISLSEHMQYEDPKTTLEIIKEYDKVIGAILVFIFVLAGLVNAVQRRKFKRMMEHDELTGLLTTYKFNEEAKKLIKNNSDVRYSIFSIDIDNFKYINELYGYDIGTSILKSFSEYIGEKASKECPIGRCFADNFIMLVRTQTLDVKVAESLRSDNKIYKILQESLGEKYNFSFSVGIYDIVDASLDFNFMVDCANLARTEGKGKMGNTVCRFSDEMSRVRDANKDVITNMNKAIKEKEFVVYYQHKNDLDTGEIIGAEALIRWISPDKTRYPGDFIPIFEKNGFIEKLDYYVLRDVCSFIKENRSKNIPRISVNISGVTILQQDVVGKIAKVLREYGIKAGELEIEITESAFIEDTEEVLQKIKELKKYGLIISMDDFGTGISSLNRLKELPIDILKLDRGLIIGAIDTEKGIVILKNTIGMAQELDMEIIAEGVETEHQAELLRSLGCHAAQGYYFTKPCTSEEFLAKLCGK